MVYPWASFANVGTTANGPNYVRVYDALRALRRLVLAFRSHSRGRLARYKEKIEHARMTKGALGEAVLDRLMKDKVLTLEGNMYFLDPSALGQLVGTTYQDLKMKRFDEKVWKYVSSINV